MANNCRSSKNLLITESLSKKYDLHLVQKSSHKLTIDYYKLIINCAQSNIGKSDTEMTPSLTSIWSL